MFWFNTCKHIHIIWSLCVSSIHAIFETQSFSIVYFFLWHWFKVYLISCFQSLSNKRFNIDFYHNHLNIGFLHEKHHEYNKQNCNFVEALGRMDIATQIWSGSVFPWCKFVQKARIVFSEWHFRSPFPFFKVFFLLKGIPSEFMEHFDPRQPLIVGGLVKGEEAMGFVQARFHAHRWLKRVLKSNDPITVSLGWRRYQTIGVFSK